jgi:uncharacterized protein (DUF4415 family)
MAKSKTIQAVLVDGKPYQRLGNGMLKPLTSKTDWSKLDAMTDAQVTAAAKADPDARPMTDEEWATAPVIYPVKKRIGLRLDSDVLQWFQARGRGYQTRINTVLRRYVDAQRKVG